MSEPTPVLKTRGFGFGVNFYTCEEDAQQVAKEVSRLGSDFGRDKSRDRKDSKHGQLYAVVVW